METQLESPANTGPSTPESATSGNQHYETCSQVDNKDARIETQNDTAENGAKTEPSESPEVDAVKLGADLSSPGPTSVSPLLSPKTSDHGRPRAATVEECSDQGEPPPRATSTPSLSSEVSRRSCLATPTTPRSSKLSITSETTVTQTPHTTEKHSETTGAAGLSRRPSNTFHSPRPQPRRPSALDFLVADSVTGIPRAALETAYRRVEMGTSRASPARSVLSRRPSLSREISRPVDSKTHAPWTSSRTGPSRAVSMPSHQASSVFPQTYTPLRPGTATLPAASMPLSYPASSVSQTGWTVDKTPMSGYQLVAAKLVGGLGGPPVVPAYRRFEALNHRLLLYMQADLVDLESHLRDLDAQDTAERAYGAIPASRRHERWTNSILTQQRAEVLGQIGYKLQQYNNILSSMRKLQQPPPPPLAEVHAYKSWLVSSRLIAEDETRFLDETEDLISLAHQPAPDSLIGDDTATPMPHLPEPIASFLPSTRQVREPEGASSDCAARTSQPQARDALGRQLSQLVLAMCIAFFVPVATFTVISSFAGRITVVLFVEAIVTMALLQSGLVHLLDASSSNWLLSASIYFGAMAAVAGLLC
ncbi:hypothetical protein CDD81_6617 [Ophiocordyceps australis]|uniref:DUF6594 domain-containing protein n=1 Tax=Ophiocordyceps australis TaxID=1399860 RepID=A0A2C5X9E7_9HYPO|nr:hypothetical protein CDD81_6617 [Ophiocordyceps australis]